MNADLNIGRFTEIPHLREDLRWMEARESSLLTSFTELRTSYDWAISFNWFSFALITVGGCVVSYASFLPASKIVASFALALLLVGVIMQAFVSYRRKRTLGGLARDPELPRRPSPNPARREVSSPRES